MNKDALLSRDGRYRYWLTRGPAGLSRGAEPQLLFIMLNPSTADADQDDPTIRRCLGYMEREGFAHLKVVNLFALRATKPRALREPDDPMDAIGADNEFHVLTSATRCHDSGGKIVCAWGIHGCLYGMDKKAIKALQNIPAPLYSLGETAFGQPCHPLYLRRDQPLQPFPSVAPAA